MAEVSRDSQKESVIDVLNRARGMELNAIAQYMNHHYNLDNQDYGDMAAKLKLIAIDEMRHAEMFAERIEEIGGEPTAELAGKPMKSNNVNELFSADEKLEDHAIAAYNGFLLTCRENGDSVSAKMFEEIINDEQIHFNYFQNTVQHIEQLGQVYLAQIAGTSSATGIQYQGFATRQSGTLPPGGA